MIETPYCCWRRVALLFCLSGLVTLTSTLTTTAASTTTPTSTVASTTQTAPMPTTTTTTTSDGCDDDPTSDCWSRPDADCFGIYEPWAHVHCPLRCGFCPNKTPPCEDQLPNCDQYTERACTQEQYQVWARQQCRKFCNLCTAPSRLPPETIHSAQWSASTPQDGQVMYACEGGTITLPWNFTLSTGVTLGDIQWFYEGQTRNMIAVSTNGHFLPLPGYSDRVKTVGSAGLTISQITVNNSGNYTVEVHLYDSVNVGIHTVLKRSVFVQISDDLMTQDGYLHVIQRPDTVLDVASGQWSVELQCGTFTFRGDPAFQVEWIIPSGSSYSSSDFSNNHFNLRLTNPVQGGNYTCRIPAQQVANTCLNGNGAHKGEATLFVDKMDARFALLEKENSELKAANSRLQQRMDTLEHTSAKINGLENRTEKLEETSKLRVAFHAKGLHNTTNATVDGDNSMALIVDNVTYNIGGAYSASSGLFTSPVSGVYFFIAAVGFSTPASGDSTSQLSLVLSDNGYRLAGVQLSPGSQEELRLVAPVHGVVHLTRGQRVGLRGGAVVEYSADDTTFSGFLVSPDGS